MYALVLLALAASANAVGRAIVTNQCDDPLYLWSVGGDVGPQVTLQKDQSYSEVYHYDPVSQGIWIKITSVENGLFKANVSQTHFSYTLDEPAVWYDLANVFGDGFAGKTLVVKPTDGACESIAWGAGKPSGGSEIRTCQADTDLELSFCTGHCLPSWYPCGNNAPGDSRACCTHCIGSHHCVAAP
ncbi:unnamed protein product [Periconia digitata]|uniref:BYS1 domain protein n=1 Tax=Periconia digitata TaxID=1303443 RepID=A0A9W4XWE8_9PLEO|nr:unnamed protein product [Periconia digitata]